MKKENKTEYIRNVKWFLPFHYIHLNFRSSVTFCHHIYSFRLDFFFCFMNPCLFPSPSLGCMPLFLHSFPVGCRSLVLSVSLLFIFFFAHTLMSLEIYTMRSHCANFFQFIPLEHGPNNSTHTHTSYEPFERIKCFVCFCSETMIKISWRDKWMGDSIIMWRSMNKTKHVANKNKGEEEEEKSTHAHTHALSSHHHCATTAIIAKWADMSAICIL